MRAHSGTKATHMGTEGVSGHWPDRRKTRAVVESRASSQPTARIREPVRRQMVSRMPAEGRDETSGCEDQVVRTGRWRRATALAPTAAAACYPPRPSRTTRGTAANTRLGLTHTHTPGRI